MDTDTDSDYPGTFAAPVDFYHSNGHGPIGGSRYKKCWCVKDICGIICAIMTWMLILYAEFVVMAVIFPSSDSWMGTVNMIIFNIGCFLAVAAHLRTMFSDPGAVPKGNATKEMIQQMGYREGQVFFKCPKCCSIKPDRAHHCSVCQRCVRKMVRKRERVNETSSFRNQLQSIQFQDHHCPWVNNCVGENNQKYFVLFTVKLCFYIQFFSFS